MHIRDTGIPQVKNGNFQKFLVSRVDYGWRTPTPNYDPSVTPRGPVGALVNPRKWPKMGKFTPNRIKSKWVQIKGFSHRIRSLCLFPCVFLLPRRKLHLKSQFQRMRKKKFRFHGKNYFFKNIFSVTIFFRRKRYFVAGNDIRDYNVIIFLPFLGPIWITGSMYYSSKCRRNLLPFLCFSASTRSAK